MSRLPSLLRYTRICTISALTFFCRLGWSEIDTSCQLIPDTACFNSGDTALVTVGKNVNTLGGTFRFNVEDGAAYTGNASVRVVLVIDKSGSMCWNPNDPISGCCTEGDGSGNCMMNDPTNMRIEAAHRFVDSLALRDPLSEIGVVTFDQRTTFNNPIPLNSANNISDVHRSIDAAACASSVLPTTPNPTTPPLPAPHTLGKATAIKATYVGLGLEAGLRAVDHNFSTMPALMPRHIIILTDGAWDDTAPAQNTPDTLISRYRMNYPERTVPTIHGIFLSNNELHTAHAYPPEGCSNTDPITLEKLEHITSLTGGLYFAGSTPSTIVDNFLSVQLHMNVPVSIQTYSLLLTNGVDNQTLIPGLIRKIGSATVLEASPQNLPLEIGGNIIKLKRSETTPDRTDSLITVILTIIRDTLDLPAPVSGRFTLRCNGEPSGINRDATRNLSTASRPRSPNAAFNLLGRKVGGTNSTAGKTTTGMYLNKSQIDGSGKSKVMVK